MGESDQTGLCAALHGACVTAILRRVRARRYNDNADALNASCVTMLTMTATIGDDDDDDGAKKDYDDDDDDDDDDRCKRRCCCR